MNNRVRQLFDQAQQLSPEEQAELLDLLLVSAHQTSAEWDKAWAAECERRVTALEEGKAELFDAGEVLDRLHAKCG